MRIYTGLFLFTLLSVGLAVQFQGGAKVDASLSDINVSQTVQIETIPDILPHRGSGRLA